MPPVRVFSLLTSVGRWTQSHSSPWVMYNCPIALKTLHHQYPPIISSSILASSSQTRQYTWTKNKKKKKTKNKKQNTCYLSFPFPVSWGVCPDRSVSGSVISSSLKGSWPKTKVFHFWRKFSHPRLSGDWFWGILRERKKLKTKQFQLWGYRSKQMSVCSRLVLAT